MRISNEQGRRFESRTGYFAETHLNDCNATLKLGALKIDRRALSQKGQRSFDARGGGRGGVRNWKTREMKSAFQYQAGRRGLPVIYWHWFPAHINEAEMAEAFFQPLLHLQTLR